MAVGALLDRSRASKCGIGVVRDLRGVQRRAATAAINGVPRIELRKADGAFAALETVAGGRKGSGGDGGDALKAGMGRPHGCVIGKGVLYVADSENHRVRRVK